MKKTKNTGAALQRFAPATAKAIGQIKYLYIRAGGDHRFVPIWVVVVDGRVLVRPWNDKARGWYRTFLENPRGAIQVNGREVGVRAVPVKRGKLNDAMDVAYGEKYTTKANQPYVKGFATTKRRATTLELFPD
ncbi:MAG: DUF2255 family protein [Gemmatimonadaceae bacterium]